MLKLLKYFFKVSFIQNDKTFDFKLFLIDSKKIRKPFKPPLYKNINSIMIILKER